MKAHNITQTELANRMGCTQGAVGQILQHTGKGYVKSVINICLALNCDIKDVIRYEEGDLEGSNERHDINWDQLGLLMQQNNETCYSLTKKLQKGPNFMSVAKKRGSRLTNSDIEKLCVIFNCKREDFVQ